MHESRGGGPEAAGLEIEPTETCVIVEVEIQPFAPGALGLRGGDSDELCSDPRAPMVGADLRAQQKA